MLAEVPSSIAATEPMGGLVLPRVLPSAMDSPFAAPAEAMAQAVARVALRVRLGGHHVPEEDVRRRFDRSRRHFLEDYLPLADEWGLWDNAEPPPRQIADSKTHTFDQLQAMLSSSSLQEAPPTEISEMSKIVLEAGRVATEKMLDYYRRMGIRVTPQMTLADDEPDQEAVK